MSKLSRGPVHCSNNVCFLACEDHKASAIGVLPPAHIEFAWVLDLQGICTVPQNPPSLSLSLELSLLSHCAQNILLLRAGAPVGVVPADAGNRGEGGTRGLVQGDRGSTVPLVQAQYSSQQDAGRPAVHPGPPTHLNH